MKKTIKVLEDRILSLTSKIQKYCPELLIHQDEMALANPSDKNPEITVQNLINYYTTLNDIYKKYLLQHNKNEVVK